jgi:tetratricopeptide (TPR) repeat protein
LEIFQKVIENAPYGKYAAASQYKIGLTLKAKGEFTEATEGFQKVLDNYPNSEWAEPAKFQIAICAARSSLDASYDQTMTQEAVEKFKTFLATHPDAELSDQAGSVSTNSGTRRPSPITRSASSMRSRKPRQRPDLLSVRYQYLSAFRLGQRSPWNGCRLWRRRKNETHVFMGVYDSPGLVCLRMRLPTRGYITKSGYKTIYVEPFDNKINTTSEYAEARVSVPIFL